MHPSILLPLIFHFCFIVEAVRRDAFELFAADTKPAKDARVVVYSRILLLIAIVFSGPRDVMFPRILLHISFLLTSPQKTCATSCIRGYCCILLFVCVLYITPVCVHVGLHYDVLNEAFMLLLSLSPHMTYEGGGKIIIYGVVENTRRLVMGRIILRAHAYTKITY